MQYYYKVDTCHANDANTSDCICWHDLGSGPLPQIRPGDVGEVKVQWREKPSACVAATEDAMANPEPSAYLLTGGRCYRDRVVLSEASAISDCASRKDGSHIVPLYTLEAALVMGGLRDKNSKES